MKELINRIKQLIEKIIIGQ